MNVSSIMTMPAVSCRPTESLGAAAQLMWQHDCGAIPVSEDDGQLVGIITDRDICMASFTQARPPQAITVGDVMSREVVTCQPEDAIDAAERLMAANQIRRIPIVDASNRLVGVLSMNDVARYTARQLKAGWADRGVVMTLAAIGTPRSRPQPGGYRRP